MNPSHPGRLVVREPRGEERPWIERQLRERWGSVTVVSRGQAHDAAQLPALVALDEEGIVGLATFRIEAGQCELITLDALREGRGVGSALLAAVADRAAEHACRRLWLITSNDNLNAIRFYQRCGMRLVAVYTGAIDEARQLKPSIPTTGQYGIPVHHELEFELQLS